MLNQVIAFGRDVACIDIDEDDSHLHNVVSLRPARLADGARDGEQTCPARTCGYAETAEAISDVRPTVQEIRSCRNRPTALLRQAAYRHKTFKPAIDDVAECPDCFRVNERGSR
ncbi:MAG: hypothetical protein KDJ89_05250 [Notoacmeibacter sp.]|nr:hypothetical protein [Notoacmeibacter sp.]